MNTMSDPIETISLSSSPPGSPIFDFPCPRNKVSEMCKQLDDKSDCFPDIAKTAEDINFYHNISDSDNEDRLEPEPYNCDNNSLESNSPEIISGGTEYLSVNNYQSPKLSQKNKKTKVTESVLEKRRLKELKVQEKAEKAKEKAERAAVLQKIRQSKPDQCLKYITVILDANLTDTLIGKKAVELFKDVEFKYVTKNQRDPFSVTWSREEPGVAVKISEEKHILFIWSFEKLTTCVKYCTLIETFRELKKKYDGFKIYLAIYGSKEYYKNMMRKSDDASTLDKGSGGTVRKRRKTDEFVAKDQIDMNLTQLEVLLKISTRFLKNHQELSVLLQQVTKAIAETPHRKEIEKRDMEKGWYARGDSRDCVRIDKDFNGLFRLWLQQLSQFNKSSLDVARSIAEFYPTPYALYQAYQNLPTQKEKELLLQNIQIKRGIGSSRRIGPELSRKIFLLFGQENGELYLSQE